MRLRWILTAMAVMLLVACKSTTPPAITGNPPPPVQYEQGPQAPSVGPRVFTPGIAVAPIQHSPWTTTTNDPSVTLQAQQPVLISTTNGIALEANGLIKTTNSVNGRFNVISFYADRTGVLDSTVALQNAINAAASQGVTLELPSGTYSITNMLTLDPAVIGKHAVSNFRMIGLGAIRYVPGMDGYGFDDGTVIVYNGPVNTNTAVFGFNAVNDMTLNYSDFENLVFLANNKAGYCVKIEPSLTGLGAPRREDENLRFKSCYFVGALRAGLLAGSPNVLTKADWDASPQNDLNVDLMDINKCFFSSCGETSIRLVGNNVLNAHVHDTLFDAKFFGGNTNQANFIHEVNSFGHTIEHNGFLPFSNPNSNTVNFAECVSVIKLNYATVQAINNYSEDIRFFNSQEGQTYLVNVLSGNTVNEGRASVRAWQANHVAATPVETNTVYLPGKYTIVPTALNGFRYICTTSGTNGAVEPTWPTTEGQYVTNGTSVFQCAAGRYLVEPYSLSDSLSVTYAAGNVFATAGATSYGTNAAEDAWSNCYLNSANLTHTVLAPAFHSYAGVSTMALPHSSTWDINGILTPQKIRIGTTPNLYELEVAGSIFSEYPGGFLSLNPTNGNVWISGANTTGGYSIQENTIPGEVVLIEPTNGIVHLPKGIATTNTISGAVSVDSALYTAYHGVQWPYRSQTSGNVWLSGPISTGVYEVRENTGPATAAISIEQTNGTVHMIKADAVTMTSPTINGGTLNSTNAFQSNGTPGVNSVIWTNVISGVITQQFICTGGIITSVTTIP